MRRDCYLITHIILPATILIGVQVFAAKELPKKRTINPIIHQVIDYALPDEHPTGSTISDYPDKKGIEALGALIVSSSPGAMIGTTLYDQQHYNTMGRMVGIGRQILGMDTTTFVHFTWMTGGLPGPENRTGAYVYADLGTATYSAEMNATSNGSGYFNLDVSRNNQAIISGHFPPNGNVYEYVPAVWYDSAALAGNFIFATPDSGLFVPPPPWSSPSNNILWPQMAFQQRPTGEHITHLTGVSVSGGGPAFTLYYFRKEGNTSDLSLGQLSSCPSLGLTGWDCPMIYATAWATVALVTASKQSGKVALTWTANLPDYTATPGCDTCSVNSDLGATRNIYENDIYFQKSNNYGISWNPMQNVTHNYAATANWMPYNDIDALWDSNDELHIAWVASDWKNYRENKFVGYGARIYHWTEDYGNTMADTNAKTSRIAVQRRDDPIMCNAGAFNLNLAKLQLSECNNNLYCLFVDLWDGHNDPANPDCSKRGYYGDYNGAVNSELMVSISDNYGLAWDLPHNLTNSPTPNCDSVGGVVGPCDSDHWPSMPPKGFAMQPMDDASNWTKINPRPEQVYPGGPGSDWLPVMYINDQDPGTVLYDNSTWRQNPVRTFLMACVEPDQIGWSPEICWGLRSNIEWPDYFVNAGQQKDITRILENAGNSPVTFSLRTEEDNGPSGWLTISYPVCVAPPCNPDSVIIHLNTGGIINSEARVIGRVILEQNNPFSACTLNVEIIVSVGNIFTRVIDTLSTGVLSLAVTNTGQFGTGGSGQKGISMDYFYNPDECDTVNYIPGDTRTYIYDGSIIVGGIVDGDTILSNQIFNQGFLKESSIYPLTPTVGPVTQGIFQYWRSGTLTNHDTTLGMEISYYAPQVTQTWGSVAGKTWHADQQFITREFKVWSMDGLPHDSLAVGEVVDWDIPSDSGIYNGGGIDWSRRLLFTYGAEYNQDDATECQDNDNRYGGMAFGYFKRFNSATNKWTIIDSAGYGGYHELNSRYVYTGWKDNELYANMAGASLPIFCDPDPCPSLPPADIHSVQTYTFDYDLQPNDTLTFYSVLATVRDDPSASSDRIKDLATKGRNFTRYFGCCRGTRGDMNGDGKECNILDLTYGVDRMFRGGPVATCAGEGDVNRDKTNTDILDITFMVDRIFRGGPAPAACSVAPTP